MRSAMNNIGYHSIVSVFWLIISYYTGYYEVYRYTKEVEIFGKLLKQFFFHQLNYFRLCGIYVQTSKHTRSGLVHI